MAAAGGSLHGRQQEKNPNNNNREIKKENNPNFNLRDFFREQIHIPLCCSILHVPLLPLMPVVPLSAKNEQESFCASFLQEFVCKAQVLFFTTTCSSEPADFKTNNEKWCSSVQNINLCSLSCSKILRFILKLQDYVLEAQKTLLLLNCQRFTFQNWFNYFLQETKFLRTLIIIHIVITLWKFVAKKKNLQKTHLTYPPAAHQTLLGFLHL